MTKKLKWFFESESKMGGATAAAFRNALVGAGIDVIEIFAREVIQNSPDARRDDVGGPVRVRFSERLLNDDQLRRFLEVLRLEEGMGGPADRKRLLSTDEDPERGASNAIGEPLRVLLVEDFNAAGLFCAAGPIEASREDNFRRLACPSATRRNRSHTSKAVAAGRPAMEDLRMGRSPGY